MVARLGRQVVSTGICAVTRRGHHDSPATGWYARFRAYRVLIDGVVVGRIRPGETLWFPVARGDHRVRLKVDWTGSREVVVTVPPDPQLICGGQATANFLMFVKPSRTILLYNAQSPEPKISPLWRVAGFATYAAYLVVLIIIMNRLFGR